MAQGKPPLIGMNEFDVFFYYYYYFNLNKIMRKIKFEDSPTLKNPENWDICFSEFIKSCLTKDPKLRPTADEVLRNNKKFFEYAKDKEYLKEHLLKGVPSLEKRVFFYFNRKNILVWEN